MAPPSPRRPSPTPPSPPAASRRWLTTAGWPSSATRFRRFVSFSERAARAAGLEPPQHQLMLAIYGLPPLKRANLATLAERMCIDVEACTKLADEVLDKGLLRWTANPADRREKLLALTESGQVILRNLTTLHRNQVLAVGPTFVHALGAILSSFDEAG